MLVLYVLVTFQMLWRQVQQVLPQPASDSVAHQRWEDDGVVGGGADCRAHPVLVQSQRWGGTAARRRLVASKHWDICNKLILKLQLFHFRFQFLLVRQGGCGRADARQRWHAVPCFVFCFLFHQLTSRVGFFLISCFVLMGRSAICNGAAESSQVQVQQRGDEAATAGRLVGHTQIHTWFVWRW